MVAFEVVNGLWGSLLLNTLELFKSIWGLELT